MMWWNLLPVPQPKSIQMADRASRRLEEARWKLKKDLRALSKVQAKVSALFSRVGVIAETLAEDVEECEKRIAYAEKALEACRSELQVEQEITIPSLQKRLKELEANSEANIVASNYRRAGATPTRLEE